MSVHFSSKRDDWETPDALFQRYDRLFGFTLDVCADTQNAKCRQFFSREQDALAQEWTGICWMNPPYGRGLGKWLRKAYEAAQNGATVVCLIPSRTDTSWWHNYAMKGEVEFLRGRVKFKGAASNAPFPSAVVVFKPGGAE